MVKEADLEVKKIVEFLREFDDYLAELRPLCGGGDPLELEDMIELISMGAHRCQLEWVDTSGVDWEPGQGLKRPKRYTTIDKKLGRVKKFNPETNKISK